MFGIWNRVLVAVFFCFVVVILGITAEKPVQEPDVLGYSSGHFEVLDDFDFRIEGMKLRDGRIIALCSLTYLGKEKLDGLDPQSPTSIFVDDDLLPWSLHGFRCFEGVPEDLVGGEVGLPTVQYFRSKPRWTELNEKETIYGEKDVTEYFNSNCHDTEQFKKVLAQPVSVTCLL